MNNNSFLLPRTAADPKSVVVLTTRCSAPTDRARAAFWRRLSKATEAAYAIEMPTNTDWAPPTSGVTKGWEEFKCQCGVGSCRPFGSARMLCRKCEKAITKSQIAAISARRAV